MRLLRVGAQGAETPAALDAQGGHAEESGQALPAEPIVFTKAITSLSGPDDDIVMPPGSARSDWEIELGVVIGGIARSVAQEDALQYVAGYRLADDLSERHGRNHRNGQLYKGKSFDTLGPIGPCVGIGLRPPRFPRKGDVLQLGIAGLGTQTQHVTSREFS